MFVDLNSDLGESFGSWKMGNDDQILPVVTSANIACGFHAGDPLGILKTVRKAVELGVTIGAHVSYPDLVGFGRRNMDLSRDELIADVLYQISALDGLAKVAGSKVQYVKPHGALYNTIAHDQAQAAAVIDAIKMYNPELVLVALAGSNLVEQARAAGLKVVSEAFADRAYNSDGSLVSRRLEVRFYTTRHLLRAVWCLCLKMVGSSQLMAYLPQFRLTRFAYMVTPTVH